MIKCAYIHCNNHFEPLVSYHTKKYCSSRCRHLSGDQRRTYGDNLTLNYKCTQCGVGFIGKRISQKFCSNKCNERYYRNQRKQTAIKKVKYCKCGAIVTGRKVYCSKRCTPSMQTVSSKYHVRDCVGCGNAFKPMSYRQKHCSTACGDKHSIYKSHTHAKQTKFYNTKEWQQIRKEYFSIAINNFCVECDKKGKVSNAYALDHRKPVRLGGTHEHSNMQGLCRSHHQSKSAIEGNLRYSQ